MESVAAGDDVAPELHFLACVAVSNERTLRLELVHGHVVDLELDRPAGLDAGGDQVLHDLLLPVDGDVPARQPAQVDAVPRALELQLEPVVGESLLVQA